MKRRWWFLGLFAPQAVAQKTKPKPLPDQCPACGTMVPVRKDQVVRDASGAPVTIWLSDGSGADCWVTRCARCNAAFWQDVKP